MCFLATVLGVFPGMRLQFRNGFVMWAAPVWAFVYFLPTVLTEAILSQFPDQFFWPHVLHGLVYPCCCGAVEYTWARIGPLGAQGAVGYTQFGVMHMMQLVSVTGMWGVSFLIAWTGEAFARFFQADMPEVMAASRRGLKAVLVAQGVVIIFGYLRMNLLAWDQVGPTGTPTVRVAGLTPPKQMSISIVSGLHIQGPFMGVTGPQGDDGSSSDWQAISNASLADIDWFVSNIEDQAKAGAGIIVSPENALHAFEGSGFPSAVSFAGLQNTLQKAANASGVYIAAGIKLMAPWNRTSLFLAESLGLPAINGSMGNRLLLLGPGRQVPLFDYAKGNLIPFYEAPTTLGSKSPFVAPGEFSVGVDAPAIVSQLSGAICFDMQFPRFIAQAANADMFFEPASAWMQINPRWAYVAAFRAVEIGANIFHLSQQGTTLAVDYLGNVITFLDHFALVARFAPHGQDPLLPCTDFLERDMLTASLGTYDCYSAVPVAYLPLKGVYTVYGLVLGDTVAYLTCAITVMLLVYAASKRVQGGPEKPPKDD